MAYPREPKTGSSQADYDNENTFQYWVRVAELGWSDPKKRRFFLFAVGTTLAICGIKIPSIFKN